MEIRPGDFNDPRVLDLIAYHHSGMRGNSPVDKCHVLDSGGLEAADISFWTVWDGSELLGCGALKSLGAHHGEVKSMRTYPQHLRKGVGAAMLDHIIATARSRGYRRVSLETGSGAAFDAALALYRGYGFTPGAPFGDYVASDFNQFFHFDL